MSDNKTVEKEENKKNVNNNNSNKQKGFFNPNLKGGKGNFFNQRNTFQKQIRNNHRPQG